ncbi:MAG: TraV family lipoprotein [Pseudomonadota bacterium]
MFIDKPRSMRCLGGTIPLPRRSALLLLALALPGCETISETVVPGGASYSCSGRPEGVVCASTREIYARTETATQVHEEDLAEANGPVEEMGAAPEESGLDAAPREGRLALEGAGLAPIRFARGPDASVPMRTPPQLIRIWIAPWEDRSGRLRMPGHIFAEVTPRGWQVGSHMPGAAAGLPDANHLQTPEMIEAATAPPEARTTGSGERREASPERQQSRPADRQRRPETVEVRS